MTPLLLWKLALGIMIIVVIGLFAFFYILSRMKGDLKIMMALFGTAATYAAATALTMALLKVQQVGMMDNRWGVVAVFFTTSGFVLVMTADEIDRFAEKLKEQK